MSSPTEPSASKESSANDAELYQQLVKDFESLYALTKPIEREYALLQKAKAFESCFGLTAEEYERLFNVYVLDARTPDVVERIDDLTSRLEPVVRIFQSLASLAIIISAFQFVTRFQEQRAQLITERWSTIASKLNAGSAKREALEYLHDKGELMSGVELIDVQLSRLNLPVRSLSKSSRNYPTEGDRNSSQGASLQEAKFDGSNLYQAYFRGANLYLSSFASLENSQTNLNGANFTDTDLRQADFTGADLRNACFAGANLEKANFTGAYLDNADFRDARFLTAQQLEQAAAGVRQALYNATLTTELNLKETSTNPQPASCRIQPRKTAWWQSL